MFSGIIEYLGLIQSIRYEKRGSDIQTMEIIVQTAIQDLILGESVAVNGVCLTVTHIGPDGEATFFISSETLERTSLKALTLQSRVNLERAVTPSTRLSGHIVQGHVDATGRLVRVERVGDAHQVFFALPGQLRKYVVEKGSIALDGISLTVNGIETISVTDMDQEKVAHGTGDEFIIHLMIIPHTWEHTRLGQLEPGDSVNVEVDIIAKYVENLCLTQK